MGMGFGRRSGTGHVTLRELEKRRFALTRARMETDTSLDPAFFATTSWNVASNYT
jgi:hypothetical protein